MIVETTNYFAKAGMASAVLAHRRRGSALRVELGLEAGRILVRLGEKGPDVRWECTFVDQAAFDADVAVREASPQFATQRHMMSQLLERFERHVFALDDESSD